MKKLFKLWSLFAIEIAELFGCFFLFSIGGKVHFIFMAGILTSIALSTLIEALLGTFPRFAKWVVVKDKKSLKEK